MKKKKHKHKWKFVRIYYKSVLANPFPEKRVSSWICDCGCMKEVEVKFIGEGK